MMSFIDQKLHLVKKMARNHFWPLERGFPTHSSEEKVFFFSKSPRRKILGDLLEHDTNAI